MIIKIYENTGTTLLAEFTKIISANIVEKISATSNWFFEIPANDASISATNLKEFNVIELYTDQEEFLFKWFISGLEVSTWNVKVVFSDQNSIWKNKLVYTDKNYTATTTISSILSGLLWEINARFGTGYTLQTSVTDTITEEVNFSRWETFFNVLTTLAKLWYEFVTRNSKLEFNVNIWDDKTNPANPNYFKYEYNVLDPFNNNVENVNAIINSKNIANALVWKAGSDYAEVQDNTSITEFGRIEKTLVADWDVTNYVTNQLAELKDSIKELTIIPQIKSYNELWLWDLVDSEIVWENNLINFNWTVKVLEKKYTVSEGESFEFKLSPVNVITRNFVNEFIELQDKVQKILLK